MIEGRRNGGMEGGRKFVLLADTPTLAPPRFSSPGDAPAGMSRLSKLRLLLTLLMMKVL